jgi:hypothetical protein
MNRRQYIQGKQMLPTKEERFIDEYKAKEVILYSQGAS